MKKKKGLDLLIEALLLVNCSYSLTAVGSGDNWYVADLKKKLPPMAAAAISSSNKIDGLILTLRIA